MLAEPHDQSRTAGVDLMNGQAEARVLLKLLARRSGVGGVAPLDHVLAHSQAVIGLHDAGGGGLIMPVRVVRHVAAHKGDKAGALRPGPTGKRGRARRLVGLRCGARSF